MRTVFTFSGLLCDVCVCVCEQEKLLDLLRGMKLELERLVKQSPDKFDSSLGQTTP